MDEKGEPIVVYHGTPTPGYKRSKANLSEEKYQELSSLYKANDTAGIEDFWVSQEKAANVKPGGFDEFSHDKIGSATDAGFAGKGFYFSSDNTAAESYGSVIMPTYLKATKIYDFEGKNFTEVVDQHGGASGFTEWLKSEGYDGAKLWSQFMVIEPTQIKSATGNQGTFDPKDPNIKRAS